MNEIENGLHDIYMKANQAKSIAYLLTEQFKFTGEQPETDAVGFALLTIEILTEEIADLSEELKSKSFRSSIKEAA